MYPRWPAEFRLGEAAASLRERTEEQLAVRSTWWVRSWACCTCMRTCVHPRTMSIHVHTHIHIHVHTHMHAHMHVHMHMHMHMHMHAGGHV